MKTKVLMSVLLFVSASLFAQSDDPKVAATPAQIARARATKEFQTMLALVTSRGEKLDVKTVRVIPHPEYPGLVELRFALSQKDSKRRGRYEYVGYVQRPGKPPVLFFKPFPVGGFSPVTAIGCTRWGPWREYTDCIMGNCPIVQLGPEPGAPINDDLHPLPEGMVAQMGDPITLRIRTCVGRPNIVDTDPNNDVFGQRCSCELYR